MESSQQTESGTRGAAGERAEEDREKPSSSADSQPLIVGLGASAGGLKALQAFFEALPDEPDMAFVVITHQAPDQESHLADLLQAQTSMPVNQVHDTVPIEPNHIYVIPPGKELLAVDHTLATSDFEEPHGQRAPVDHFFRSLATFGDHSVGIILSGGGTDGSVGIKTIKENGGVIMVQDPEEASFDSMPRSAIATGLVDLALPAAELAQRLMELRRHPVELPERPDQFPSDDAHALEQILSKLRSRVGHDFSQYKHSTVQRRIKRRMQVNRHRQLSDYLSFLEEHPEEAQALFEDLLISVTSFFRDASIFETLAKDVIPKLFEDKTAEDWVRVWVAGCSTGEEAYSVAMLLLEHTATLKDPPRIKIFASDISRHALAIARKGRYPLAIRADVSQERLDTFFVEDGDHYRVKRELRELILFAQHSVLRDPPFANLDLLLCRNLLIYLQRSLQEHVFDIFHYALRPSGYLLLGSSESLHDRENFFRTIHREHRIYQARPSPEDFPRLPTLPHAPPETGWPATSTLEDDAPEQASLTSLHEQLLETYAPPSILVNESSQVVHLSETAGRYLQHPGGSLTSDVIKLVRPGLQFELQSALYKAFTKGQSTVARPVTVHFDGPDSHRVYLTVRPKKQPPGREERLDETPGSEQWALILFNEDESFEEAEAHAVEDPEEAFLVQQLREELRHTREQLQHTIKASQMSDQELKAANEELRSINEEYKTTAEELETSKEELQSLNEELETVNEELQASLEEMWRANNDLKNLMAATEVDTLFLDRQLRIRRYTPQTNRLFHIQDSDLGRPIQHISHILDYDTLKQDAEQVLDDLEVLEREVKDDEGRWYLMRVRPYRTDKNEIEGVVLSFVDITELKTIEAELRSARDFAEHIVDTVREGLLVLDENLRVKSANRSFHEIFQLSPDETIGRCFYELEEGQWDHPQLRELLENVQRTGSPLHDFEVEQHFDPLGSRIMRLNACPLQQNSHILLTIEDVTERKRDKQELQALNQTLEERVEKRTQEVRELASKLTRAEQKERQRISRILHDDLQQRLYGIQLKMSFMRRETEAGEKDRVLEQIDEAEDWTQNAIETTRQLAVDLTPPVLDDEGLAGMLEWLISQMKTMHALEVDLRADQTFRIADEDMRVLLFQSLRELLFNVVKHADTDRATVELSVEDQHLVVRVIDAGNGFDVEKAEAREDSHTGGIGLFSVRERLRLFGGRMDIQSSPGDGTTITIHTPVDATAEDA